MSKVTCSVCGCACEDVVSQTCPECGDCVCDECASLYEGYCQGCYDAVIQKFE